MKQSLIAALTLTLGCALAAPALAEAEAGKPLALRGIMQDLGRHMQTASLAIAREDWALVEKTAPLIAEHTQPPVLEKTRIMAFIGTGMGRFKGHDQKTHEAAKAMAQAAANKDGQAVIAAFKDIQIGCLGCHQEFRKPFVEHFYGAR